MPKNFKFPIEIREKMAADYLAGKSAPEIAKEYKCSARAVLNSVRDRGVKVRLFFESNLTPQAQQDAMVAFYLAGESAAEAGAHFGFSQGACNLALKRAGVPKRSVSETKLLQWARRTFPVDGKHCTICGEWKLYADFLKCADHGDGHASACRVCAYARTREDVRAPDKRPRKPIPLDEYLTLRRQKGRERYHRNRAERREKANLFRAENPEYAERCNKLTKQWAKDNREKVAVHGQRRRARKAEAGGSYTANEWRELVARCGGVCLRCSKLKPLTVDHVIPISKGGSNFIWNLQPLCKFCNTSKGTKTMDFRPDAVKDWLKTK